MCDPILGNVVCISVADLYDMGDPPTGKAWLVLAVPSDTRAMAGLVEVRYVADELIKERP